MKILFLITFSLTSLLTWSNDNTAKILLASAYHSPSGLIKLSDGPGTIILLVHGINPDKSLIEWVEPVTQLMDLNKNLYFYRWSKFKSMKINKELFLRSIKTLLTIYKSENLVIIGHSAGGAIALLAKDALTNTQLDQRIYLHTVASPIFGYGAPPIAYFGAPFAGMTAIELGIGVYKKLKNKHLNQCTHWVNTNCELDPHSCPNSKKFSPQQGKLNVTSSMPCGVENTYTFNDENHLSLILRTIEGLNL